MPPRSTRTAVTEEPKRCHSVPAVEGKIIPSLTVAQLFEREVPRVRRAGFRLTRRVLLRQVPFRPHAYFGARVRRASANRTKTARSATAKC
jgi:hypothetical protein